jgi:aspartate kinase
MALIVQKYGGTSVATVALIQHVAKKIKETRAAGHDVVVVVSAMGGETDRLEGLAKNISNEPNARELDVLLATGEQVSVALISMALMEEGVPAVSMLGHQIPIVTDGLFNHARIIEIADSTIRDVLATGKVVIVAGFQGIDRDGQITTLGRGGSDTTAVALAAALGADECQIYTDVEGVYTTDPKIVIEARRIPTVTFEEMLELSSLGAKVLESRAVEFAGKYQVPVRVLSTFVPGHGTLITHHSGRSDMNRSGISGIAFCRRQSKLGIRGVPNKPGVAAKILGPIGLANIEVDMMVQNIAREGQIDFVFTVARRNYKKGLEIIQSVAESLKALEVTGEEQVAKLSLIGVGMSSHPGVASQMFQILGEEDINIHLIATSEIKISVVVDEAYLDLGVRVLHQSFSLHAEPKEVMREFDNK